MDKKLNILIVLMAVSLVLQALIVLPMLKGGALSSSAKICSNDFPFCGLTGGAQGEVTGGAQGEVKGR